MTNEERISSAKSALMNSGIDPDTPETDIIDLITNLLRLAWEEKLLPQTVVGIALHHFKMETGLDVGGLTTRDWADAVDAGDTLLGYHDWVNDWLIKQEE